MLTLDYPFMVKRVVAKVARSRERPFVDGHGLRCHDAHQPAFENPGRNYTR